MIGLDTNILVRLLVGDDLTQTAQARRFVDNHCTPESPGFINCVVLAELVWVLTRVYNYRRSDIADAVESLLMGQDRLVEHHAEVRAGLEDYRAGSADFIDAIILHINRASGCDATATFDRKAGNIDGFIRVS
jgi:predicted nucleic-acid-binding protein